MHVHLIILSQPSEPGQINRGFAVKLKLDNFHCNSPPKFPDKDRCRPEPAASMRNTCWLNESWEYMIYTEKWQSSYHHMSSHAMLGTPDQQPSH